MSWVTEGLHLFSVSSRREQPLCGVSGGCSPSSQHMHHIWHVSLADPQVRAVPLLYSGEDSLRVARVLGLRLAPTRNGLEGL